MTPLLLRSRCVKTYEGATVFLAENTHKSGKTYTGVACTTWILEHNRKSNRMNPHPASTILACLINSINRIDCSLHIMATEFIAKNIYADVLTRIIIGFNGCSNAFYRATIAERSPGT